ncbi:MAG TPA: carboxylesterase/lipase family protein [Bacteroidota bacterium]|nr:carboxylesterase/lipase family protein [Bacteroidota bacterium]
MNMRTDHIAALIAFGICAAACGTSAIAADTLASVEGGRIRGTIERPGSGVCVFRGIPYARPPVGSLRWKPPAAVEPWSGTRECTQFAPGCIQPEQKIIRGITGPQSEDCLYLNVWTAGNPGDKRPVMVWIHGGGFTIGSGSQATYDGLSFAEDGAVEVTLNYRLGPFGFMAHPALSAESPEHASGNYGLMDMIAALRWVRDNVAEFGGDPGNVTIFGESAGSAAVGCLIASPRARGLFHRAIMESGVPVHLPLLHEVSPGDSTAEAAGVAIAREAGIAGAESADGAVAARLRALPADALLRAANPRIGLFGGGRRMGPAVDGDLLPRQPLEAFASGEANNVPVIIGSNADEGTLFLRQIPIRRPVGYVLAARRLFGGYAEKVLELFPVRTADDVRPAIARLVTVSAFVAPARRAARALSAHDGRVWLYHFTRVAPPLRERGIGATHGIELFYVFRTFPAATTPGEKDYAVSSAIHGAWLRFAKTGDPNLAGEPRWPAYTAKGDAYMEFGDSIRAGSGLFTNECDLFDEISAHRGEEEGGEDR